MRKLEEIYVELSSLSKELDNDGLHVLVYDLKDYLSAEDEKKAVKGWKKGSGDVKYPNAKTVTVEVYRDKNYPGIMIHRNIDADMQPPGWVISHELSGLRLSIGFPTMGKAVKAFMKHEASVNWNRPSDDLLKDNVARNAGSGLNSWG